MVLPAFPGIADVSMKGGKHRECGVRGNRLISPIDGPFA